MLNLNKMSKTVFLGLILLALSSCGKDKDKYKVGSFPVSPVNLMDINSEYDDYNSTLNILGETFPLCFSSNRNTRGGEFDIVYKYMSIQFSQETGILNFSECDPRYNGYAIEQNANLFNALSKINTSYDELGPYLILKEQLAGAANVRYNQYVFLYSNNSSGNQDIKFTQNLKNEYYAQPLDVAFLNSEFDDAYPVLNKDNSEIYFTSNRENNFDIYRASIDKNRDLVDLLTNTKQVPIQKDTMLSSAFDDKCPFIVKDFIVFTSNRPGGFGGYDLYYSHFANGTWAKPVNFGSKINTEYDEYRPIVRPEWDFTNDVMIFSSNRPGGKGGFDLYYVGIDKISQRTSF